MTSIKVRKETHTKLNDLKYQLKLKSLDKVINNLIDEVEVQNANSNDTS